MSQITGADIFKGDSDCLSDKALKRAKKKGSKELTELISRNLNDLVEYYFGQYRKERMKYEKHMLRLFSYDKRFIAPLLKIVSKKNADIPSGLHVLLMDNIFEVRAMYDKRLELMKEAGRMSEDATSQINTIDTLKELLIEKTMRVVKHCVKKQRKELEKIGFMDKYAEELAATYVPAKYLNPSNVRRYTYRINSTLYKIQEDGLKPTGNNNEYVNDTGTNLGDSDVIKDIYEFMFKGINKKTLISMLVGIMLERRGEKFSKFTKPQLSCYNAITNLCLDVMEGETTLRVVKIKKDEYTAKKKSKKAAAKKARFDKKDLKKFMEYYSAERSRDIAKHRDSPRRISFATGIADDAYPNIMKAFKNANQEYFDNLFENDARRDEQKYNDEQRRRDDNRNRDDRNRDRDRDRRDNRWKKRDRD